MARNARITGETLLHSGRFKLTRFRAEVEQTDGSVHELNHEIYQYGMAASVLLYDPSRAVVLLVKQFRLGAFIVDGSLDMLEACAGMLDGDSPEVCARREAWEETGVKVGPMTKAFETFMSPGGVTEKISCFVAPYGASDRIGHGGGVDADEYIELVEMPIDEALRAIERGVIRDAKTVALLYYARATGLL